VKRLNLSKNPHGLKTQETNMYILPPWEHRMFFLSSPFLFLFLMPQIVPRHSADGCITLLLSGRLWGSGRMQCSKEPGTQLQRSPSSLSFCCNYCSVSFATRTPLTNRCNETTFCNPVMTSLSSWWYYWPVKWGTITGNF
jgi:hypothetical protein